jgi:putative ABC transport system permease protein
MYFIRRALKYLKKKKGKTLLLGIIFIVIANFVLAGMLVQNATQKAQEETRISIGAGINYTFDWDGVFEAIEKGTFKYDAIGGIKRAMMQGALVSEDITKNGAPSYKNVKTATGSKYVKSYSAGVSTEVILEDINAFSQVSDSDSNAFEARFFLASSPAMLLGENAKLVSGSLPTEAEMESGDNVILIEKTVADLNSIKAGDKLKLQISIYNYNNIELDYKVAGIYSTTEQGDQRMAQKGGMSVLPQNRIYIPLESMRNIGFSEEELDNILLSNVYIDLDDPLNVESYKNDMENRINMGFGMLDANDDMYNNLVGPLSTLGSISSILVVIISLNGALIIGLITALSINERKEEFGILLAVGEGKFKIVSQLVLEVVIIALITFTLSTFTASFIGKTIGEKVLSSGILESQQEETNDWSMLAKKAQKGFNDIKELPDKKETIDVSLETSVIIKLLIIGLLMAIISTIIPSLYVMRFNPKQILINRSS